MAFVAYQCLFLENHEIVNIRVKVWARDGMNFPFGRYSSLPNNEMRRRIGKRRFSLSSSGRNKRKQEKERKVNKEGMGERKKKKEKKE